MYHIQTAPIRTYPRTRGIRRGNKPSSRTPISSRNHSINRSSSTPFVEIGRKRERPMPETPYDWTAIQRLSDTAGHFNRFISDILLWDLVRSYPDYIAYDRRGNEIGLAHLVSPPAYARQSESNPWGTYGPVTAYTRSPNQAPGEPSSNIPDDEQSRVRTPSVGPAGGGIPRARFVNPPRHLTRSDARRNEHVHAEDRVRAGESGRSRQDRGDGLGSRSQRRQHDSEPATCRSHRTYP